MIAADHADELACHAVHEDQHNQPEGFSGKRLTTDSMSAKSTTFATSKAATVVPNVEDKRRPSPRAISARFNTTIWNATKKKIVGGRTS